MLRVVDGELAEKRQMEKAISEELARRQSVAQGQVFAPPPSFNPAYRPGSTPRSP